MTKRKSQLKKKKRTGLIITSISAMLLLLVLISLLVFKPWNSSNQDSVDNYYQWQKSEDIEFDKKFAKDIENHRYKPIKSNQSFELNNHVESRYESDGEHEIQIPSDWTIDESNEDRDTVDMQPKEIPRDTGLGEKTVLFTRINFETRPIAEENYETDRMEKNTTSSVLDDMIKESGSIKPAKPIDKFEKKINGIDYQVAVVAIGPDKHPELEVIYTRLLDKGSLEPSILTVNIHFGTSIAKEFEKKAILDRVYSLEDTLGSFDESD